jgi:hypothetical protein
MGYAAARNYLATTASRCIADAQEKSATMKRKIKPQPEPKQPDFEIDTIYDEIAEEEVADWYITGFPRDDPNLSWYKAMDTFDWYRDTKPLIEMLLDPKWEVTPAVRVALADLLKRHKLVRLPGKQQTPIYAMSTADTWFLLFTDKVFQLTKNGISRDEAIKRVESFWGLDGETLTNAVIGKRSSLNRALKNLARLTSKDWVRERGWRKKKLKAKLANRAYYDLNLTTWRKKPIRSRTRH